MIHDDEAGKPMLDANDARELTAAAQVKRSQREYERQISKIIDDLHDAIEGGHYEFTTDSGLLTDVVQDLKDLGYNIEYVDRKGVGQNYYRISWKLIEKKKGRK